MVKILKIIFHISVFFLIVISLWPGSLLGFFFYGDWRQQPNLIANPLLGFFLYFKDNNFPKLVYGLFFLAVVLEFFHFIIPNRSFQPGDLIGNILGVVVAYLIIKIYLFFNKS